MEPRQPLAGMHLRRTTVKRPQRACRFLTALAVVLVATGCSGVQDSTHDPVGSTTSPTTPATSTTLDVDSIELPGAEPELQQAVADFGSTPGIDRLLSIAPDLSDTERCSQTAEALAVQEAETFEEIEGLPDGVLAEMVISLYIDVHELLTVCIETRTVDPGLAASVLDRLMLIERRQSQLRGSG